MAKEVALIYCGVNGLLDKVPMDKVAEFEKQLLQLLDAGYADTVLEPLGKGILDENVEKNLRKAAADVAGRF